MNRHHSKQPASRLSSSNWPALLLACSLVLGAVYLGSNAAAESPVALPAPAQDVVADGAASTTAPQSIVLAGGCFWGIQAVFQHTKGVLNAVSGYAGGKSADATYEQVSGGNTGHAEAVQISFDPKQITYGQILQIYFSVAHDPTQLNRQYPDSGTQYRSAVFYQDAKQKLVAERYIAQLDSAKLFPSKIVTQLSALQSFYAAEKYHQNYATLHPDAAYIARFDLPKIAHLKTMMPAVYREQPILVQ
nr:peptide-methionine (S)-S-oxide reductase MsrA [Rhodoferax sp.]